MADNNTTDRRPSDTEPTESSPGDPATIDWDENTIDLDSLQNGSGLPQVVKFTEVVPGVSRDIPPGLRLYADQPVLLHTRTGKTQIQARTVYHDQTGPYYEVGQTLVLPVDFEGWFELVPPDFGRGHVCRTIGQVAEVMPRKFFTRSTIRAIRLKQEAGAEGEEPTQKVLERKISAASVLGVLGTFAARWKTNAKAGLFKAKHKEWTTQETNYLKCKDVDGEEILIPCDTRGRFSIIYEKGLNDSRQVFRMKDLVTEFTLPLKVRMVFGRAPVVPCIFTGFLVLKGQGNEDTLIGSTILNKRNVLFEAPVSMKCNVHKAVKSEDYSNLATYKDAEKLCNKYALSYSTLIKLSPDLDTNQQMVQHIPTERRRAREDSLRTLDIIQNISRTDSESRDFVLDDSDSDSIHSADLSTLAKGQLMELKEITLPRASQVFTEC